MQTTGPQLGVRGPTLGANIVGAAVVTRVIVFIRLQLVIAKKTPQTYFEMLCVIMSASELLLNPGIDPSPRSP